MLRQSGPWTPRIKRWASVVDNHRAEFTQVREIDLLKASIRLPKGRFFVSVTERQHFDKITETIPGCVQTRLEEFLGGPGKKSGVKVYYLKPLCVEVDDALGLAIPRSFVNYFASLSLAAAAPLMVCDPAFVAEMPGSPGDLLKIGHFDEVGGITHVEI